MYFENFFLPINPSYDNRVNRCNKVFRPKIIFIIGISISFIAFSIGLGFLIKNILSKKKTYELYSSNSSEFGFIYSTITTATILSSTNSLEVSGKRFNDKKKNYI